MLERKILARYLQEAEQAIPEGAFYAPQFYIVRGSELGYHCHLFKRIKDLDTGVLLTLPTDESVFAEVHRSGKVSRPVKVERIPDRERRYIANLVMENLSQIPLEARRKPSRHALRLNS